MNRAEDSFSAAARVRLAAYEATGQQYKNDDSRWREENSRALTRMDSNQFKANFV